MRLVTLTKEAILESEKYPNEEKKIVHYGDEIDPMYGLCCLMITKDELAEMLKGGVLYATIESEYAVCIGIEDGGGSN